MLEFLYQVQECHDIEHSDDINSDNPHNLEETAVTSLRTVYSIGQQDDEISRKNKPKITHIYPELQISTRSFGKQRYKIEPSETQSVGQNVRCYYKHQVNGYMYSV